MLAQCFKPNRTPILQDKRKRLFLSILFSTLFDEDEAPLYWFGIKCHKLALNPRFGLGRGAPGQRRLPRRIRQVHNVWMELQDSQDEKRMHGLTHMTLAQFSHLLSTFPSSIQINLDKIGVQMTFPNKILLIFIWIVKYPDYSLLTQIFGCSPAVISCLLSAGLPLLMEHFNQYIPLRVDSLLSSHLSPLIKCVLDSTIHPIRRPSIDQYLYYNGNYETHGILSHLLVDFEGLIVAVTTNVYGRIHDANAGKNNYHFQQVLGGK